MAEFIRMPATLCVLASILCSPVYAQVVGQEPAVLQGITAVDAQVAIVWSDGITKDGGVTETQYEQAFTEAFRSGLTQGGLQISTEVPNYLYCTIALQYTEGGLVSAAQAVEYHEPMGPDNQWVISWTHLQVFAVGLDNFDGADDASWCAEAFVADWRAGNGG